MVHFHGTLMPNLTDAQAALDRYFGFNRFREGQAEVIEAVLGGQDVIVVMPTGGGKSLCYQLPALLLEGTTLVISPLIALMKDQVDSLAARGIAATFINSSLSFDEQLTRLGAMARGGYRLVYIAPERFRNARFLEALREVKVSLFAVDEAHCVSQWGHDFRPDYLRLREAAEALGRPQIIALTATATPFVRSDISEQLGLRSPANSIAGFDRHNLALRVLHCKTERERTLQAAAIAQAAVGSGIIYAATRKNVEQVAEQLVRRGLHVAAYHAGLDEATRTRVQDRFMAGELKAIIATNAFGMGIDKADLRFVTHYNLPGSIEAYYQEIGRAGRDGLPSVCTLLFNYVDTRTQNFFIEGSYPPPDLIRHVYSCLLSAGLDVVELSPREIGMRIGVKNEMAVNSALIMLEKAGHIERGQGLRLIDRVPATALRLDEKDLARRLAAEQRKLREMVNYAYHEGCLRRFILRYFGDRKEIAHCNCSNCRPVEVKPIEASGELRVKGSQAEQGGVSKSRAAKADVGVNPSAKVGAAPVRRDGKSGIRPDQAAPSEIVVASTPNGPRPLSDEEHLATRKILSCIARLEGRFGKGAIAGVLRGSRAKNILANELDQIPTYGLLSEYSQDELTRFINALIVAGCVRQSGGAYPTVSLTELGRQVMRDRCRVELDLESVEADTSDESDAPPSTREEPKPVVKGETRELTYQLYREGLSVREIAERRGLKPLTIEEHLASLIEEGRDVRVEDFVSEADRPMIEAAARRCGLERLKPIKDALPDRIDYCAIRMVVAVMRRQREEGNEGPMI